jgi:predicted amidohydrolase
MHAAAADTDANAANPPAVVMVASVQMPSAMADLAANEALAVRLIREAAATGAKFVVLPETCFHGYLGQDLATVWHVPGRPRGENFCNGIHPKDHAEVLGGPLFDRLGGLTGELGIYLTVPYLEKVDRPAPISDDAEEENDEEGSEAQMETVYYNSVALLGPDGATLGNYRKMSPWPDPEAAWAWQGTDPVVVDTPYGRVGLAICFDIHSCLSKYARHRLWALLYPIAWVGEPSEWYRQQLPSLLRQVDCPHYVIGANWSTDVAQKWPGAGYSTHYGPRGEIVASTGDQTGCTIVYSHIFTAAAQEAQRAAAGTPRLALNVDKYAQWTASVGGQAKQWRPEWR